MKTNICARRKTTGWWFAHAFFIALAASTAPVVSAQDVYPTRPITMLVGFPPGGFTDFVARLVGKHLSDTLGQPVVIENRGGANGLIAANVAASARPDGYVIYMTSMGLVTNPYLYAGSQRDPIRDFTPISLIAHVPNVLVAGLEFPARNVSELLEYARSRDKPLLLATTGRGAPGGLVAEMLQKTANVRFEEVAYKGSGPALVDVTAGRIDISLPTIDAALQLVKGGKLRAIAVTGDTRVSALPDVPTVAESGFSGANAGWYGLIGPAGMPKDIVTRLSDLTVEIVKSAEFQQKLSNSGARPVGSTNAGMAEHIAQEYQRWGDLIRKNAIKADAQ